MVKLLLGIDLTIAEDNVTQILDSDISTERTDWLINAEAKDIAIDNSLAKLSPAVKDSQEAHNETISRVISLEEQIKKINEIQNRDFMITCYSIKKKSGNDPIEIRAVKLTAAPLIDGDKIESINDYLNTLLKDFGANYYDVVYDQTREKYHIALQDTDNTIQYVEVNKADGQKNAAVITTFSLLTAILTLIPIY